MRSFNHSHLITDENWVLTILKTPAQKVFLVLEGRHGESREYIALKADLDHVYTEDGQKNKSLKIICKVIGQEDLKWLSRQTMTDAPQRTRLLHMSSVIDMEGKSKFDSIVEQSLWDDVESSATTVSRTALQSLMSDTDGNYGFFPEEHNKYAIQERYERL